MPEKGEKGGEGGLSAFHPSTYLGGILAMGIGGSGCEDGMGWRGWMATTQQNAAPSNVLSVSGR